MSNKVTMVDPDEGWKYGFPKVLPEELKGKDITSWLIQEGYPLEKIEQWNSSSLGYTPMRTWETDVLNVGEDTQ
jgi:hypothetical protein|tara:strand:- start:522 stop:743 length:222 start_codon:yes stop_codon:yes gene_type:complete